MTLFVLLILPMVVFAADSPADPTSERVEFDLATYTHGGEFTPPVTFGEKSSITIEVVLTNAFPIEYDIKTDRVVVPIPALQFPSDVSWSASVASAPSSGICSRTAVIVEAKLKSLKSESEIPSAAQELLKPIEEALEKGKETEDALPLQLCLTSVESEISRQTTKSAGVHILHSNETFTLTVMRKDTAGKEVSRKLIVKGKPPGEWRLMYGFSFLPNQNDSFFTEAVEGQAGKFTIKEKAEREDFDLVPTLMYAWKGKTSHGFAAGLAYDFKEPVVFAGYQYTVRENIGLFAGLAVHQQTRLDGKYEEGDTIGTSLENAQLTTKTYAPNAIIGLSFRFDKSPFAKAEEKKPAEPAKKEEKK